MGVAGTHVDGTLFTGDEEFRKPNRQISVKLDSKPRRLDMVTFSGIEWTQTATTVLLPRKQYADRMIKIPMDEYYRGFMSALAKMA